MSSRSAMPLLLAAALAAAGCDRQSTGAGQANAIASADEVAPDEAAPSAAAVPPGTVDRSHKGAAGPTAAFETPDGKPATLADFRGKPVLVNLWATWCAPCVKELPTLDAAAGGPVRVVAISQDMDATKAAPFLAARGIKRLEAYRDPRMNLSLALGANLPTTILYDAAGREVWRYTGSLDWNGAEAKRLIAEAV